MKIKLVGEAWKKHDLYGTVVEPSFNNISYGGEVTVYGLGVKFSAFPDVTDPYGYEVIEDEGP